MDLVVDTSAIIAVVANEAEKPALVRLTRGADLVAPGSVHWEVGNALGVLLKRDRITLRQAHQALVAYQEIPIRFMDVDLARTMEIVREFGIYAYDAYVIACAELCRVPLVTLDRGLARAATNAGVETLEVTP